MKHKNSSCPGGKSSTSVNSRCPENLFVYHGSMIGTGLAVVWIKTQASYDRYSAGKTKQYLVKAKPAFSVSSQLCLNVNSIIIAQ